MCVCCCEIENGHDLRWGIFTSMSLDSVVTGKHGWPCSIWHGTTTPMRRGNKGFVSIFMTSKKCSKLRCFMVCVLVVLSFLPVGLLAMFSDEGCWWFRNVWIRLVQMRHGGGVSMLPIHGFMNLHTRVSLDSMLVWLSLTYYMFGIWEYSKRFAGERFQYHHECTYDLWCW